ncbi:hypothetical protein, partial [Brucella grignonensis]|uniref:hypothetical protein n=1 Tax=Brucella grignonensis TaxID=94627 RepID=UPI001ABFB4AA
MGDWLGPDSLWLSFPVAMLSTMLMAGALYLQGGWRKSQSMHTYMRSDRSHSLFPHSRRPR